MAQRVVALLGFVLFLGLSAGEAQLTTGTITGTVTDQSGAAVPGATVTVRNVETGISRTTITGSTGRYEATNLTVGNYEVNASMQGFQISVRRGIELTVGRNAVVGLVLQVGEVTQSVTVTGEAALVETTTATVASLVNEKRVEELPLNNRDLNQLAFLQPGVLKSPEGSNVGDGLGSKILVGGARAVQNLYLLDGVPNSDYAGSAAGAGEGYTGAETVKEFQIIANNYSAEYKSTPGAVISAVTKSGTNSFHGSAFEFLRNDNLDAANFFDNAFGNPKPEFKRNQFGGSLGGPIVRDRTFFFGSYEGLRERLNSTQTARIPTVLGRQGVFPNRTVPVNAAAQPYVNLFPIPGQGNSVARDFGDGTVLIAGDGLQPTTEDVGTARLTHQFSGSRAGSLSGTYSYSDSLRTPVGVLRDIDNRSNGGSASTKHTVSVQHTSVLSPTSLNEFNFGYSFSKPRGDIPGAPRDFGSLVFVPGRTLLGDINTTDLARIGYRGGGNSSLQKSFTFKDGVSLTRGNHSLRFGAEFSPQRYDIINKTAGYQGAWTFSSLASFLAGDPELFAAMPLGHDDVVRNLTQMYFGSYLQDNYRVANSLTLNLGLRYEFVTVPNEVNGKESNLVHFMDPAVTLGVVMTNPTLKSFSPRFGFAWAPGSRKTSVRGGFGIFYDFPMLANVRSVLSTNPPFTLSAELRRADAVRAGTAIRFPDAYTTQQDLLLSLPALSTFQYDAENTYVYRWSLTVQRELGAQWVASAGYSGSRAVHLWGGSNPNMNRWEGWPNNPTGPKFWPPITGTNRINPAWGAIRMFFHNENAFYQGLGLGLQKALSSGLQLQVAYTFSKTIDEGTSLGNGSFGGPQHSIIAWDMHLKRSLSSQDIRNNLSANFSYALPLGQNLTGLGGALAKGWQLNGIWTLTDGSPASVLETSRVQTDRIGDIQNLTVDLKPGGNNNPTSGTSAGCAGVPAGAKLGGPTLYYDPCQFSPSRAGYLGTVGRNTVILPGLATFDFSLMKAFSITENSRLQFRAELFNLFNRVNFGVPDMTPFTSGGGPDANAGVIVATRTKAREIQFGLRYSF